MMSSALLVYIAIPDLAINQMSSWDAGSVINYVFVQPECLRLPDCVDFFCSGQFGDRSRVYFRDQS